MLESREKCFRCHRPATSCMCGHITPVETRTKFVILMHPKELKKTKNGTGRLTHLSLPNSEIHVAIDFSDHKRVGDLIADPDNACYVLYPGEESINLSTTPIGQTGKNTVIFLIDSTWPCSKKILRLSTNLAHLPKVSFESTKLSQFKIKQQPKAYCLSTIESTLSVLELLNRHGNESIASERLEGFLHPFETMVDYQLQRIDREEKNTVRFKERPSAPVEKDTRQS